MLRKTTDISFWWTIACKPFSNWLIITAATGTKVIGITGTNGKTTTKELISAVLSKSHNVLYTEGNLNNHIGVPMTLLRLKAEHELAVIEMGLIIPER